MESVAQLKKEARQAYHAYYDELDQVGGDGGRAICEIIRPSLGVKRERFNAIMDRLSAIDPSAPSKRL